jgi:amino acid permease
MSPSASSSSSPSAKSPGDSPGHGQHVNINDAEALFPQPVRGGLHRGLSARQVQMIAIGGTIGTGLFLGTGRSLAQGGPASMLICYGIVGFIVYVTLLLLGEMATQYPVAGVPSFFIFRQHADYLHLCKGPLTPMRRAFFRRLMVLHCRGTIGLMMQCLLPLISLLPS